MVKRSSKLINIFMEFIQILMVFLGVTSALTCTATGIELVYDRLLFITIMAVACVIFYALFTVLETIRGGKLAGIAGLLIFYVLIAFRFREELYQGTITIINNFLKQFMNFTGSNLSLFTYNNTGDAKLNVNFSTTLVMIIVGVFIVAVVSAFFYRKRRSSVFIICTVPFMLLPFYVGRVGYFMDVILYLSVLVSVIGTRQLKTNSTDRWLRQKLSILLLLTGLIIGTISYIIVPPDRYDRNKDKLLETKNTMLALASWDMEDIFTWIRSNFNESAIDYGKIGKTSGVNHTGRTLIKISGDVSTNYGLYLKGFVANVYENNKWTSNKKSPEYKEDLATLSSQNITPDSYHVQLRNDVGDNEKSGLENIWNTGEMHVRNLAFGFGNYLIPVLPVTGYITEGDGSMHTRIPGIEYDEEYYLNYGYAMRRILMTPSEDLVDPVFWTTYEEKSNALKAFAEKYYLQIPEGLEGVCEDFKNAYKPVIQQYQEGEGDISDVLRAVRAYISRDTVYSENPGKTPSDRDSVEYFLTENKKGYCTYYATSAAILLRSLGIPTRYVEGLYITQEELEKGVPGEISVPDYDAHAWIEVYDPRYGFVTFETTPGRGEQLGSDQSDDGGYSDGSGGDGPAEVTPTPTVTQTPEESMEFEDIDGNEDNPDDMDDSGSQDGGSDGHQGKGSSSRVLIVILIIVGILAGIALVAEGQRRIRMYMFRKKLSDMKNKRRRIRMTHRHLTPYFMHRGVRYHNQSMAEYIDELCETLKVPRETVTYYVEMVFHGAFGPDDLTDQAMFKFREVYEDICRHAYRDARLPIKIYYMYIMVL